jgi:hydrogenase maturation protease
MKTLVLGIGNLLMGDEGVGVHVLRHLETHAHLTEVDLVDGGTGGFHLLEYFETYERVLLIDAAADGEPPGTVRAIQPRYASDYPPSLAAHDIGLKDLIEGAQLLGHHPEVVLVTISIAALSGMSLELSHDVRAAIEPAAQTVTEWLANHPGAAGTP